MIGWGVTNEAQKIQKTNKGLLRNKNGFQKQKDAQVNSDLGKDWKYKEASPADLENVRVKLEQQRKNQFIKSGLILIVVTGIISILLVYFLNS